MFESGSSRFLHSCSLILRRPGLRLGGGAREKSSSVFPQRPLLGEESYGAFALDASCLLTQAPSRHLGTPASLGFDLFRHVLEHLHLGGSQQIGARRETREKFATRRCLIR